MRLGLYAMKYPVRRLIAGLLPWVRSVPPDVVSWAVLPVGLATAGCYLWANSHAWLLLVAPVLIVARMFLATLDGLMAVEFGKQSPRGELANRVPPELADVALLLALAAAPGRLTVGLLALGAAWMTTFAALVGLTAARPTQSVGPAGSTDRLAVLIACSLVAYVAPRLGYAGDVLRGYLWYVVVGGGVTVALRLWRTFAAR